MSNFASSARACGLGVVLIGLWSGHEAAAQDPPPPQGIWELANGHDLGFKAQVAFESGGLLVASDLKSKVVGVRPDSGLVVWSRELGANAQTLHRLETSMTPDGDVVLVVDDGLKAFRADVGTRLWELAFSCRGELCDQRVVYAGPVAGRGAGQAGRPELMSQVLLLARGGSVQSELVRLDPRSGRAMWKKGAATVHPRRVVVAPSFIAVEEAVAPFTVVFVSPEDGQVLGRWERRVAGVAQPPSELIADDDRLVAIDLRPGDGTLAHVIVVGPSGEVITERQVARPAPLSGVEQLSVEVGSVPPGLALFTPVPAERRSVLTLLRLQAPWTARSEVLNDGAAGVPAGSGALRFGAGHAWFIGRGQGDAVVVNVIHESRSELVVKGFPVEPAVLALNNDELLLVAPFEKSGASAVTVQRSGLHGFGAPDLTGAVVHAALVNDDLVLVTRGKAGDRVERLVLVAWSVALERLRAAFRRGADLAPLVGRLSRFYPVEAALGEDVKLAGRSDSVAALSEQDLALVAALRDAWRGGDPAGTLDGMRALVEQQPERSERRLAMLNAFAVLVLDLVLAPGAATREDVAERLVGLARLAESEAQRCHKGGCEVAPTTLAIYAAAMALIDEPLAGADLLQLGPGAARGPDAGLADGARKELARRALHLLRRSAGTLRSDTSRQMLVSGLRFFRHFDDVMGESVARAAELLDLAGHDADAARELEGLLISAEGPPAAKRGAGPGLCQLACEAAEAACGEVRGRITACQQRCEKTGAVRFSPAGRVGADPRWFCR